MDIKLEGVGPVDNRPGMIDMLRDYFVTALWQDLWQDPWQDRNRWQIFFLDHDRYRDVKWAHILGEEIFLIDLVIKQRVPLVFMKLLWLLSLNYCLKTIAPGHSRC